MKKSERESFVCVLGFSQFDNFPPHFFCLSFFLRFFFFSLLSGLFRFTQSFAGYVHFNEFNSQADFLPWRSFFDFFFDCFVFFVYFLIHIFCWTFQIQLDIFSIIYSGYRFCWLFILVTVENHIKFSSILNHMVEVWSKTKSQTPQKSFNRPKFFQLWLYVIFVIVFCCIRLDNFHSKIFTVSFGVNSLEPETSVMRSEENDDENLGSIFPRHSTFIILHRMKDSNDICWRRESKLSYIQVTKNGCLEFFDVHVLHTQLWCV